jgi:hypothetical protein
VDVLTLYQYSDGGVCTALYSFCKSVRFLISTVPSTQSKHIDTVISIWFRIDSWKVQYNEAGDFFKDVGSGSPLQRSWILEKMWTLEVHF